MKTRTTIFTSLAIMAAALIGCTAQQQAPPKEGSTTTTQQAAEASGPQVPVELYIMSKCPYGAQAAIPMVEAVRQLKGLVDLKIDYIAKEDGADFKALHGPTEVKGNIYQLCAREQDTEKFFTFITCVSKEFQKIPDNSEACATEAQLDVAALKACAEGEQGKKLLKESIARADAGGAKGSPTIKIAGEMYRGGRGARDFMRAFCAASKSPNEACAAIPPPVKVQLTVLTDQRCQDCGTDRYEAQLRNFFPGLEVKKLDYATPEGKELYTKTGVKLLPALLFDESVTKGESYQQFERRFKKMGDMYYLQVRSTFDPTAEICDNKIDDTGDGKIDCDDATCKDTLVCRPEKKNELAVFVMSQCPYGVKALDAMKEVLAALGDAVNFKVHYIANATPTGFTALHGQPEVDENIRELCAYKHYPKKNKWMDYVWCRNTDIRSTDWQKCTGKNGIDTAVIKKCFEGDEGKALLAEDIKEAEALQIGASPTWLANNRYKFSGIQAEQIKAEFCKYNPGVKGCDKTLSTQAPGAPVPAGACGAGN